MSKFTIIVPISLFCPDCGAPHEDVGERRLCPHKTHLCLVCGEEFEVFVRGEPAA